MIDSQLYKLYHCLHNLYMYTKTCNLVINTTITYGNRLMSLHAISVRFFVALTKKNMVKIYPHITSKN